VDALYDYYDENYYYEMVETRPVDKQTLIDPNLYQQRVRRRLLISELQKVINY